jgi:hypothetical protein
VLREQLRRQRRENRQAISAETAETLSPATLPPHLGWGSDRLLAQPKPQPSPREIAIIPDAADSVENSQPAAPTKPQTVIVHPSLLVALLKHEVVAIGRIWLLARSLDKQGRGWLTVDELRLQLTAQSSPLRICGWRRLRQILQQGKGTFWERDQLGRLFLHSTIRVAKTLNVTHFSGDAIALPVSDLLGTIGNVQAAFYTSFHCGRAANPIARATLNKVTGVPERTQRHYDNAQNTERIANFSLVIDADDQEAAWQHGRATFTFTDNLGKRGAAGKSYTAIRLPNSYQTTRYARLSGKRKRLNHQLSQDLVNHGTQGNSKEQVQRLFFSDGQRAARAFNQNNNVYLHDTRSRHAVFWTGWVHVGRK